SHWSYQKRKDGVLTAKRLSADDGGSRRPSEQSAILCAHNFCGSPLRGVARHQRAGAADSSQTKGRHSLLAGRNQRQRGLTLEKMLAAPQRGAAAVAALWPAMCPHVPGTALERCELSSVLSRAVSGSSRRCSWKGERCRGVAANCVKSLSEA